MVLSYLLAMSERQGRQLLAVTGRFARAGSAGTDPGREPAGQRHNPASGGSGREGREAPQHPIRDPCRHRVGQLPPAVMMSPLIRSIF